MEATATMEATGSEMSSVLFISSPLQSQLSGFLFLREISVNMFHDPVFWSKGIQISKLIFASNSNSNTPLVSRIWSCMNCLLAPLFALMVIKALSIWLMSL